MLTELPPPGEVVVATAPPLPVVTVVEPPRRLVTRHGWPFPVVMLVPPLPLLTETLSAETGPAGKLIAINRTAAIV
jgi:hypothetical protein